MIVKKAINLKVVPLWSETGKPSEKITKINTDTEVRPFFQSLFKPHSATPKTFSFEKRPDVYTFAKGTHKTVIIYSRMRLNGGTMTKR